MITPLKSLANRVVATSSLRFFGFTKIPMLYYCRPTVLELNDERVVMKIPLTRRTRNHLGSMYFGALCVGADAAGGLIAMNGVRKSKKNISLVFKDMSVRFLKRAEGDVVFTCTQGRAIGALVRAAVESAERVEMPVEVVATVPDKLGDEPVAQFTLTLSLKRRS